ncbi:MAG: type 1 glutamine amidotransferase, partial [Alphaproteobacteria bacterium]
EMGFAPLTLTPAAADDPLLAGLASPQWIMQWHNDTFDMPVQAALLMTNPVCRNQAFRLGRGTYGFQGHFEVTRDLLGLWLAESKAAGYHAAHPDFYARIEGEMATHITAALRFCRLVGERWASLVTRRRAA